MTNEDKKIKVDYSKQSMDKSKIQKDIIPKGFKSYPVPEINGFMILPKNLSKAECELKAQEYLLKLKKARVDQYGIMDQLK